MGVHPYRTPYSRNPCHGRLQNNSCQGFIFKMEKRYSTFKVEPSEKKTYLEKVEEQKEEIEKRLTPPSKIQTTLNEFIPKNYDYWRKYNAARTKEKTMFYMLLDELLKTIPDERGKQNGRPPYPLRDIIFCACLKLYHQFSARRISSDLDHAHKMGFIGKPCHFNTLVTFLNNPLTEDLLKYLITLSAMPLKSIEKEFAIDSSGFGSYQYERWMRTRFGQNKRGWRDYVKLHISIGRYTQIITAAEVTYGNGGDITQMPYLLQQTNKAFNMEKVLADKAYSGRKMFELIATLNALPIIPFKSNATGTTRGSPMWSAMFEFFTEKREDFEYFYGQRAQVESAFSRMKRNFGEFLKSKNHQAQKNEVLLKCLCHNLACVINEVYQRGIKINFEDDSKQLVYQ